MLKYEVQCEGVEMLITNNKIRRRGANIYVFEPEDDLSLGTCMNFRTLNRIQSNTGGQYFEIEIKRNSKPISIGFALQNYPLTKKPGLSRTKSHHPTIGFDSEGNLYVNGTVEVI